MGKNSAFWKWMVSYVAVMLVFLLCNRITYWQGKRILVRNQEAFVTCRRKTGKVR